MPGIKGLFNFAERGIIRTEGLKIKSGKLKLRIRGRSPAGRAQSGCSGTSPGCPSAGDGDVTRGGCCIPPRVDEVLGSSRSGLVAAEGKGAEFTSRAHLNLKVSRLEPGRAEVTFPRTAEASLSITREIPVKTAHRGATRSPKPTPFSSRCSYLPSPLPARAGASSSRSATACCNSDGSLPGINRDSSHVRLLLD